MDEPNRMPIVLAAADAARRMVAANAQDAERWRHVVLQALDDYESDLRTYGIEHAQAGFENEPEPTGDERIDAALAALAEHLARRDGWTPPAWCASFDRVATHWWFVDELPGLHALALRESPLSFRKRGIFVGEGGLSRA